MRRIVARRRSKRGQGITEYGAMIAFVAVLISLAFAFNGYGLRPAVSAAFSAVSANLNNMSSTATSASS